MLNDRSSTLALLRTRRSGRPRDMVEPGPDSEQLADMLAVAARTPDHGKLAPWRFIHIGRDARPAFRDLAERAYRAGHAETPNRLELEAVDRFALQAPELVVVLSSPIEGTKIPLWEQELSCGAACMNLLLAAHAHGFTGGWITGWAAYSPLLLEGLGGRPHERIAGFIYLGTPAHPLEERVRPAPDHLITDWTGSITAASRGDVAG